MNKNFNSRVMKRAWTIRRLAAVQYGVLVSQISWRECLIEASAVVLALAKPNNKDKGMKMATPKTAAEIAEYINHSTGAVAISVKDGDNKVSVEWELLGVFKVKVYSGDGYVVKVSGIDTDTVKFRFASLEEALEKILSLVKEGIELPTSQKWVARGNTYPAREQLKAAGFRWNGSVWFYQGEHEPHFQPMPPGVWIYKII